MEKRFLIAVFVWASLFTGHGQASGEETYVPARVVNALETVIPNDLKHLFMDQPFVRFHVAVDAGGVITDQMPVYATHFGLIGKAEEKLREAEFEPATQDGEPSIGFCTVVVTFFDPEQRAWRSGSGITPLGGDVSDSIEHKMYKANPGKFVFEESSPGDLQKPLTILKSKLVLLRNPDEPPASGQVIVEYLVDHTGTIRFPKILRSDAEILSLSVLRTLQEIQYEAPVKDGKPTYVRVRQPFNFD